MTAVAVVAGQLRDEPSYSETSSTAFAEPVWMTGTGNRLAFLDARRLSSVAMKDRADRYSRAGEPEEVQGPLLRLLLGSGAAGTSLA